MSIPKIIRGLFIPSSAPPGEITQVKAEISRRNFFSFFGVGAAMLAKPELFVPKRPTSIVVKFSVDKVIQFEPAHVGWDSKVQKWGWWDFTGKWLPLDEAIAGWNEP